MKHILESKKIFMVGIFFLIALSACTVQMDGGSATPEVPPGPFGNKPRVAGPAVEGAWSSACVRYGAQGSRRLSMSFTGDHIDRISEIFQDTTCQQSAQREVYKGQFIFSAKYPDGKTEISYAMDLGSGTTLFLAENILIEDEILFVSDFVSGDMGAIHRNFPMKKATPEASCENYQGSYQMNAENFTLNQIQCQQIRWVNNARQGKSTTYILDGIERDYNGTYMKASIENRLFRMEYKRSGRVVVEKWSFQKVPCYLSNPDGRLYLTKNIWVDGIEDKNQCDYYAKYQ